MESFEINKSIPLDDWSGIMISTNSATIMVFGDDNADSIRVKFSGKYSTMRPSINVEKVVKHDGLSISTNEGELGSHFEELVLHILLPSVYYNGICLKSVNGSIWADLTMGVIRPIKVGYFREESQKDDIFANVYAKEMTLINNSGNISLIGSASEIEAENVSGNIELTYRDGKATKMKTKTVSGDIDITFEGDYLRLDADVKTEKGHEMCFNKRNPRADAIMKVDAKSISGNIKVG